MPGFFADRFSHLYCSSFYSTVGADSATCVRRRPLAVRRTERAKNEGGVLTGSFLMTELNPFLRTVCEEPFHPRMSPRAVVDWLMSLGRSHATATRYTASDSHGHSTGRGGYANITDIKSPDIEPPVHVTHPEHERVSTGRGGVGNIRDRSQSKVRDQPEPHIRVAHPEVEVFSSGRGGAGNIRSRSQSKPPGDEKVWSGFFSSIDAITPSSCPPFLPHDTYSGPTNTYSV